MNLMQRDTHTLQNVGQLGVVLLWQLCLGSWRQGRWPCFQLVRVRSPVFKALKVINRAATLANQASCAKALKHTLESFLTADINSLRFVVRNL